MTFCAKNTAPSLRPDFPALQQVQVEQGFFGQWLEKIAAVSAGDILAKFQTEGAMSNYEHVAAGEQSRHIGPPWYHGLICECIRGISDMLVWHYDPKLDAEMDRIIGLICKAQEADPENFINPYTTLECPTMRWGKNGGDVIWQHETYNTGCLAEAGVHHYRATGKTALLQAAVKMCDFLADFIGDAPKHNVVCEHALPEEAILKLYQLLQAEPELSEKLNARPEEYLRLVRYFIHHKGDNDTRYTEPRYMREYSQDHRPAREQREAIGHAVRANLFYTGMAALALEDQDTELAKACSSIWQDIVETKLHMNGGVGAHAMEEKYGIQYELPDDAYLETCAGVALIFFGSQMFRLTEQAAVWETVENTLYNVIPASVSADGTKYTYVNPLLSKGNIERWDWHGCPCCPPMLLKLAGCLPTLVFAQREDTVWLNLYIDSVLRREDMTLTLRDNLLTVTTDGGEAAASLRIRIPSWAKNFSLQRNGADLPFDVEDGYAVVCGPFANGDQIRLCYDMVPEKYTAHPYVRSGRVNQPQGPSPARVAIKYGPFLYCAETVDNPGCETFEDLDFELDQNALTLETDGTTTGQRSDGAPFRLIPYHTWNNRGPLPMRIWFRQQGLVSDPLHTEGWEGLLYRPI